MRYLMPVLRTSVLTNPILFGACLAVFLYPSHLVIAWAAIATVGAGLQYISDVLTPEYEEKLKVMKQDADLLLKGFADDAPSHASNDENARSVET